MSSNPNKVSKLKKKLVKILNNNKCIGTKFTHTLMTPPFGKFNIEDSKELKKINKLLGEAIDENIYLGGLMEKQQDYGPILVDVDLELPKEEAPTRLYNDKMINGVIESYRKSITQICDVNNKELSCLVFEKDSAKEKDNKIKDGFHLVFPDVCLHYKKKYIIRQKAIELLKEKTIFNDFNKSVETIVDEAVVHRNNWIMYGCGKSEDNVYKITKYYNYKNKELPVEKFSKKTSGIIKKLSLRNENWNEDNETVLNKDYKTEDIDSMFNKNHNSSFDIQSIFTTTQEKKELITSAIELVDMLSKNRADNYDLWMRVGWALHNTDYSLLEVWDNFSKLSPKYKPGECRRRWTSMRKDGYTYLSLRFWAQEDSPEKFEDYKEKERLSSLKLSTGSVTFSIAKALYVKYYGRFVCTDPVKNEWYIFENHRWRINKGAFTLLKLLSTDFADEYRRMSIQYATMALHADTSEKSKLDEEKEKFDKISKDLLKIQYKKSILEEAKNLFYDEYFFERLDENKDIIGFNNGVYDLKLNEFRMGRPDDYLTKSTGCDYIEWNENRKTSKDIIEFFRKIFPDESVRNYFLTVLSTCVSGENKEEKAYFETGTGSNGKSVTQDLIKAALGEYFMVCPCTILTRKSNASNQASPELARMKGIRIAYFQEPDTGETINVGKLKELTGNDTFPARALHQDMIEIKPQFKLFLTCNELPKIPSADGGTWRRIRVIPFKAKFVEKKDLDPDVAYQYLIDKNLKGKIDNGEWGPVFAGYLIHLYQNKYSKGKLIEPKMVTKATDSYNEESNVLKKFFDETYIITGDKKNKIPMKDIIKDYRGWCQSMENSTLGGGKLQNTRIVNYFQERLKQYDNKTTMYKLKYKPSSDESDSEENDLDI